MRGGACTPELGLFPSNDDERERRERRRSRAIELQRTSIESPLRRLSAASRLGDTWLPDLPQWNNSQIADHYSTCIKLSTENKITMKNAFGLHLIDYMSDILKQKDSKITDFKMAAGALDASAKIYAMRVDVVHADTYKVLGGLGKDSAPTKNTDNPQGDDSSVAEVVKKVQTKKKHSCKTIETNLDNINRPESDRKWQVDPMFQMSLAALDENSTAGFFLARLRTQSYHSELLFEDKIVPLPSSETLTLPNADPVKVPGLKSLLEKCAEERPICSTLAGFRFTRDMDSFGESVSALLEKCKKSELAFDINAKVDSDVEDFAPNQPDDDFNSDSPQSASPRTGEPTEKVSFFGPTHQSKKADMNPFGEGDIGTMCLHLSKTPRDYSYFSPQTLAMWGGPEHWRFAFRQKAGAQSEKLTKKGKTKKEFDINFDEDIDFKVYFRKAKECKLLLSKSIRERDNVRSTTLPTDFEYDVDNLSRLFLKPSLMVSRMSEPISSFYCGDEIGEYDYNNPNDTSNFCPGLQVADGEDDDPVPLMDEEEDFNFQPSTTRPEGQETEHNGYLGDIAASGELELIPEPPKVKKRTIQYAKTAKQIDMRLLKKRMWDILCDTRETGTAAEVEEEEDDDNRSVVGEKIFSNIIRELQHRLPPTMANNLSVPIAFNCLLHLANEKTLMLVNTEDFSDVIVTQD